MVYTRTVCSGLRYSRLGDRLTERVGEDLTDGEREAGRHILPVEPAAHPQRCDRAGAATGAPHVDLPPKHELGAGARVYRSRYASSQEVRAMAKQKRQRQTAVPKPTAIARPLAEAVKLLPSEPWTEARDTLVELDRSSSRQPDALLTLLETYRTRQDYARYQQTAERLRTLLPDDPDVVCNLVGAYLVTAYPLLAMRTFREYLQRWPEHPRAGESRQAMDDLEASMDDTLAEMGLHGERGRELGTLHEEARALIDLGKYAEARRIEERVLAAKADFPPALNNISLTYGAEGDLGRAISTAQQVLRLAPDNFHALSNLTRYCCLLGRVDEATEWATRLKAVESTALDVWSKKAEALSYLGDDTGVLDAFHGAERAGQLQAHLGAPMLYHLAAVAEYRLGREREARRHWEQALKLAPGYDLAQTNVDDLRRPVAERHAPWPFPFGNWLSDQTLQNLVARVEAGAARAGRRDADAVTRLTIRYMEEHPAITALVPLLLDRGDPAGREFAVRLARLLRTPALLQALHDFALSQRGPDALRNEASAAASEAGLVPPGPVRMWLQGEWREVLRMDFEITPAPQGHHSPEVERLLREAIAALREDQGERAEPLLRQALAIEPDAPEIWNNLAVVYSLRGQEDEAMAITQRLHQQFPEYLFARVSLARNHLLDGQVEEAKALLEPLRTRKRFHVSEFAAYSQAQIELCLAQGQQDGARTWLKLWKDVDPDNPQILEWTVRLLPTDWLRRLRGRQR